MSKKNSREEFLDFKPASQVYLGSGHGLFAFQTNYLCGFLRSVRPAVLSVKYEA